jgi:hypothetical protein
MTFPQSSQARKRPSSSHTNYFAITPPTIAGMFNELDSLSSTLGGSIALVEGEEEESKGVVLVVVVTKQINSKANVITKALSWSLQDALFPFPDGKTSTSLPYYFPLRQILFSLKAQCNKRYKHKTF